MIAKTYIVELVIVDK